MRLLASALVVALVALLCLCAFGPNHPRTDLIAADLTGTFTAKTPLKYSYALQGNERVTVTITHIQPRLDPAGLTLRLSILAQWRGYKLQGPLDLPMALSGRAGAVALNFSPRDDMTLRWRAHLDENAALAMPYALSDQITDRTSAFLLMWFVYNDAKDLDIRVPGWPKMLQPLFVLSHAETGPGRLTLVWSFHPLLRTWTTFGLILALLLALAWMYALPCPPKTAMPDA